MVTGFSQYKDDFFNKLNFDFKRSKKLLDIGCGPGTDAEILTKYYGLDVYGIDIYKDENIKKQNLRFKLGSIDAIPFRDDYFDYVFVHDVLHHIDEKTQKRSFHLGGLSELRRVCKKDGYIIVVEGNRYNPLFYPHMVLMRGHNHFRQKYFKELIGEAFNKDSVSFKFFEAHFYPVALLPLFKLYELVMEKFSPKRFLAYNGAIIKKQ